MSRVRIGLRYMAESALFFSFMSALVKYAGARGVPWEQIVFARAAFALVVTYVWLRRIGVDPRGNARGWLVLRGALGVVGLMCFYYSITHIPLGDATVIQYTNPAFVAVFAVVIVAERLRLVDVLAVVLCLVGVAFIARPSFLFGGVSRLAVMDVGIALGGAVASALAYTTVRRLGRTEHPLVTVLWFPLVATPLVFPLAAMSGYVPDLVDLAVMLGVGITSQVAQVRMTQGLKLERAGRATAITYLQVVFAFILGAVFFDEVPTLWNTIGAAVVIGTTLALALRKRSDDEPELRDAS